MTGGLEEQISAGRLFGRDGNAFSLLSHKVSLDTGKDHGLYGIQRATGQTTEPATGSPSFGHFECQFVLQKPSIAKMRATPGVIQLDTKSGQEYVNCDSSFYFSHAVSRMLKHLQEQHLDTLVADRIELDAYRDFLQPLGSQPLSLDEFLVSAKSQAAVFRDVYTTFAGLRTAVLALSHSQFFHLGTIPEILELYLADSDEARSFRRAICFTHRKPAKGSDLGVDVVAGAAAERRGGLYYSRLNEACRLSATSLLEYCFVGDGLALELEDGAYVNSCRLRASELSDANGSLNRLFRVPKNTCMHTVAIRAAGRDDNQVSYVTIFFQRDDDLKKGYESLSDLNWLGKTLSQTMANQLTSSPELAPACSVWSLRVFRAASTMSESFVSALRFCHSYLQEKEAEKEDSSLDVSGQLYSLFDILRLQSFESMIQFREEMIRDSD